MLMHMMHHWGIWDMYDWKAGEPTTPLGSPHRSSYGIKLTAQLGATTRRQPLESTTTR